MVRDKVVKADEIRAMFRDGRSTGLIAHDLGISVEQVHAAIEEGVAIELPEKPDGQPTLAVPKEDQKSPTKPKSSSGSGAPSNSVNIAISFCTGLLVGVMAAGYFFADPNRFQSSSGDQSPAEIAPIAVATPTPPATGSSDTIEYVIEDKEEYGKVAKSSFVVNKDYWSSASSGMVYVLEKERVIFDGWDPTVLTFGYPDNYAACAAILGFARQDSPNANFRCRVVYRKYN